MAKVALFELGGVELPMALIAIAAGHQATNFGRLRRRDDQTCVVIELAVFVENT